MKPEMEITSPLTILLWPLTGLNLLLSGLALVVLLNPPDVMRFSCSPTSLVELHNTGLFHLLSFATVTLVAELIVIVMIKIWHPKTPEESP